MLKYIKCRYNKIISIIIILMLSLQARDVFALSPESSFSPLVRIEKKGSSYQIHENEEAKKLLLENFREDVEFIYLCQLVGQSLELNLTEFGLIQLIRRDLPHINFSRFDYNRIFKYGDDFYLPYVRNDTGEELFLRFFGPVLQAGAYATLVPIGSGKNVAFEVLNDFIRRSDIVNNGDDPARPGFPVFGRESGGIDEFTRQTIINGILDKNSDFIDEPYRLLRYIERHHPGILDPIPQGERLQYLETAISNYIQQKTPRNEGFDFHVSYQSEEPERESFEESEEDDTEGLAFTREVIEARKRLARGYKYFDSAMYELAKKEYEISIRLASAISDERPGVMALVSETIEESASCVDKCDRAVASVIKGAAQSEDFTNVLIGLLEQRIIIIRKYWLTELVRDPSGEDCDAMKQSLLDYCASVYKIYAGSRSRAEVSVFAQEAKAGMKAAHRRINFFVEDYMEDLANFGYKDLSKPKDRKSDDGPVKPTPADRTGPIEEVPVQAPPADLPHPEPDKGQWFRGIAEEEYLREMAPYKRLNLSIIDTLGRIVEDKNWKLAMAFINKIENSGILNSFNQRDRSNFQTLKKMVAEEGSLGESRWIAHVRQAVKKYRPDIISRYDNISNLSADEIRSLENDIYEISSGHFHLWGLSTALNRRCVPQFKGSHGIALISVFPKLRLNQFGFRPSWLTKESALESIRFALYRNVPDIMAQYDQIGKLTEEEKTALQDKVYAIQLAHFKMWGIGSAATSAAPYFESSYIKALMEIFPALELEERGFYRDWSSKEAAIESIRFIVKRAFPDIIRRYNALDQLSEEQRRDLEDEIYRIRPVHLVSCGLCYHSNQAGIYFENNFPDAMVAVFSRLNLNPLGFRFIWSSREKAIESIRFVLSRRAPYLLNRYAILATLSDLEKEELREEVYRISLADFDSWGISNVHIVRLVPFFEGSYVKALIATFPELGLYPLGFDLSWKTKDESINSIRYVLSKKAPDIIRRYNELDALGSRETEILMRDIYAINSDMLVGWGLSKLFDKTRLPFFKGNYAEALAQVFPKLPLKREGFMLDWSTRESGMRSAIYVLEREIPRIMKMYNGLNGLTDLERQMLEDQIYAISATQLKAWGLDAALDIDKAPYFKGNYSDFLMTVFYRLHLERPGFKLDWSSHDKALESIRFVFRRKMPDIMNRYARMANMPDTEKALLRRDIVTTVTTSVMRHWGLGTVADTRICPYFGGDYQKAVLAVFDDLRMDLTKEDFKKGRIDNYYKKYTWQNGREEAVSNVRDAFKIHRPDLMDRYDRLDDLDSQEIEALKDSIYGIKSGDLRLWGMSRIFVQKDVPYFNGSYINAVILVFPRLELNPLGFRLDWSSNDKAIESVRFILNKKIPDIMDRYKRLDDLPAAEVEMLREDVYGIRYNDLCAWGLVNAFDIRDVPYFGGSHAGLLKAVFPLLNLDPLGFKLDWSTKDDAVRSLRYLFRKRVPDIMERYDNLKQLDDRQVELLKDDVCAIRAHDLILWQCSEALNRKTAPYFNGSFIAAIMAVFPDLKLSRYRFRSDWSTEDEGVASVRYSMRRFVPDIMDCYDGLSELSVSDTEDLRRKIYKISAIDFMLWGIGAAMNSRNAPYFKGSHINALQAVFPGLKLNPLGFMLRWKTKKEGLDSIRFILTRELPQVMAMYDSIDTLTTKDRELLRRKIYNISSAHLSLWGASAATDKKIAPYFKGSISEVMIAVFPKLDLERLGFQNDWSTKNKGIESVRYVIRRERPDIIRRYDNFDALDELQCESLRRDVYRITSAHFEIWNIGAALVSRSAPYFKGSYMEALRVVFPKLDLKDVGFQREWSTRQKAINSIRFILTREAGDIMRRYNSIGELSLSQIDSLRDDIYAIQRGHFEVWGLAACTLRKTAPYFNGSHIDALMAVFDDPRLGLRRDDFAGAKRVRGAVRGSHSKLSSEMTDFASSQTCVAEMLADTIKMQADSAKKENRKIIIALEANKLVIPGQQAIMQPLLSELYRLGDHLERIGLDNVRIVRGVGDDLMVRIADVMSDEGVSSEDVIVLGTESTLMSKTFEGIRSSGSRRGAFLAAVDMKSYAGYDYVRLLEMLTIAIKTAGNINVDPKDHPQILIKRIGERIIRLIPLAEPMRYEELKDIYENQAKTLVAA